MKTRKSSSKKQVAKKTVSKKTVSKKTVSKKTVKDNLKFNTISHKKDVDNLRFHNVLFNNYITGINSLKKNGYKTRLMNVPESLTEGIVKVFIRQIYQDHTVTDNCIGDLYSDLFGSIEVKAFQGNGPNSFSTNLKFDALFFVDARKLSNNGEIKIYFYTGGSDKFKNIPINKNDTFDSLGKRGIRPKISFNKLIDKIYPDTEVIFTGTIDELLNL